MIDDLLRRLAAARGFLAKLWALAKPYWVARDKAHVRVLGLSFTVREGWLGQGILALIFAMNVFYVYLSKQLNTWNGRFFDALQEKDAAAFRYEIVYWIVLVALMIFVFVYSQWFQQLLTIRWRRWLTEVYFHDWLSNQTYYRMELLGDGTDNPEQRIEQDCNDFTDQTLDLLIDLLTQVLTVITFAAVLWQLSGSIVVPVFGGITIPGYMLFVAILYSVIGTWLTYRIGKPLVGVNFERQRFNADFRYRMTRVRENAESIALYQGEAQEEAGLHSTFGRIYQNWLLFMRYSKRLNWLTNFYAQVAIIFPFIVAAPRYFAGAVPLGALTQTADAFGQVQGSLSWFVDAFPRAAAWMAVVNRLTSFGEAMERAKRAKAAEEGIRVTPAAAEALVVNDVDVRLPTGAVLIDDASFLVKPGDTVSVSGPSGSGKTTLFRVLAGLWPFGAGKIERPIGWRALFLPQRPYLPIGSLRDALCYPESAGKFSDAACREALEACFLAHLDERLDEHANWSMALSVGEQQRLAVARALLLKPNWIFIDEGTSALDEPTEAKIYALLKERLKGAAIVSIAHRPQVVGFHDRHLDIDTARHAVRETEALASA